MAEEAGSLIWVGRISKTCMGAPLGSGRSYRVACQIADGPFAFLLCCGVRRKHQRSGRATSATPRDTSRRASACQGNHKHALQHRSASSSDRIATSPSRRLWNRTCFERTLQKWMSCRCVSYLWSSLSSVRIHSCIHSAYVLPTSSSERILSTGCKLAR